MTRVGRLGLAALPDGVGGGSVSGGPVAVAAVVAVLLVVAVLVAAAARLGDVSLEAAEHRGRLAAQLRFALSLQDLRAVVLLRRRLAAEEPRPRPWLRVEGRAWGAGRSDGVSAAVRRRGLQSLLRWPVTRILRVAGLGIVAGFAAAGAWEGTTPLVIVAGAALFVAALDALEPLAQEMDHPGRRDSFPVAPGRMATAALLVPTVALALTTAVGAGIAVAVLGVSAGPMLIAVIPATAGAVTGGTASLVLEPVSAAELMSRYPVPEAAGPIPRRPPRFRPGLAMSGWPLPLLAGRAALGEGFSPRDGRVPVGALVGIYRPGRAALCAHLERNGGGDPTP